jgi:hypothetical protein
MILSTIGVHKSGKLGTKYIFRGVRFIIVIVVIIIAIIAIGTFSGTMGEPTSESGAFISNMLDSISSNPIGGQLSDTITQGGFTANIDMQWGLGGGATIILIAGIIMLIAGILEVVANRIFFEPRIPVEKKKIDMPPPKPTEKEQKEGKKEKKGKKTDESKDNFCPECGFKLKDDDMFCPECGTKI